MKAFSPAGLAVKAFFGYQNPNFGAINGVGAKTFGNPLGASSGNGGTSGLGSNPPGPPTPPTPTPLAFVKQASPTGGTAIGSMSPSPTGVLMMDQNGEVYLSTNGGNAWTHVATTGNGLGGSGGRGAGSRTLLGGGNAMYTDTSGATVWTQVFACGNAGFSFFATDGAGNWVAFGNDTGITGNHGWSNDDGTTWTIGSVGIFPSDAGMDAQGMCWDGTQWGGITNGSLAHSPDGKDDWSLIASANFFDGAMSKLGGILIAGGSGELYAVNSISQLATATPINAFLGGTLMTIAYSPFHGGTWVLSDIAGNVRNTNTPKTNFNYAVSTLTPALAAGEWVNCSAFDPINNAFVLGTTHGSIYSVTL